MADNKDQKSGNIKRGSHNKSQRVARRGATNSQQVKKNYDFCEIKKECGSCAYVNEVYSQRLKDKSNEGLTRLKSSKIIGKFQTLPAVKSPKPLAYRGVAKLAVRPSENIGHRFQIGLFQPGTHKVVDNSDCPLHIPVINQALRFIKAKLESSEINPWNESTNEGDLRYLIIRASHQTQELVITFVCTNEKIKPQLKDIINKISEQHRVFGAHLNINTSVGNNILGEKTIKLVGKDRLRERICELNFEISPQSFFQVNPWQAANLYRRIEQLIGNGNGTDIAWDLYSGIGPISMVLARSNFKVLSIEENPHAVADAQHNAQINSLNMITRITGRVEETYSQIPSWAKTPDVIILNPSRAGLAENARTFLKTFLTESAHTQLIYVSCNLETFIRDVEELQLSGHRLKQVESFDMFAQTDKLEWLGVMTR